MDSIVPQGDCSTPLSSCFRPLSLRQPTDLSLTSGPSFINGFRPIMSAEPTPLVFPLPYVHPMQAGFFGDIDQAKLKLTMEEGALFKDLVKGAYGLTFIVRIGRIWDHYTMDRSKYYGINLVMVDRKGGVIEGVIPPEIVHQFQKRIREGSVYKIQNYLIERPKYIYRAADHPHRLSFIKTTIVTPIVPQPVGFPLLAHNALPFSEIEKRIGSKELLSDTVGLMIAVTDLLPPTGASKEPRRQITITDGQKNANVTLWGEFAQKFDADSLCTLSKREPVIIMFLGMLADQYGGTLSLKSTTCTRWHVNVDIHEMKTVLNRISNQPYEIKVRNPGQAPREKVETTISAFRGVDPATTLKILFKFRVKIIRVVSLMDWMYMGCKICWKGLTIPGGGLRSCPNCPDGGEPWPRYKIRVHAIDDGNDNEENAPFAEFLFFGALGEQIASITADCAAAHKIGRTDYLPPGLEQLPGKRFILTAVTQDVSLKYDFYMFQVKAIEHLENEEPLAPLPMLNTTTISPTSESKEKNTVSTPATSEHDVDRDQPSHSKDGKSLDETSTSQSRKRQQSKDKLSPHDHKKSHVAKQLFTSGNDQDKAEAHQKKAPDMEPK